MRKRRVRESSPYNFRKRCRILYTSTCQREKEKGSQVCCPVFRLPPTAVLSSRAVYFFESREKIEKLTVLCYDDLFMMPFFVLGNLKSFQELFVASPVL